MSDARRVLLVYGYEPSGHSAAALAIETAGREAGLSFFRVEIAADHHPAAGQAVARGYHALLRAFPSAWGALYRSSWAFSLLRDARAAYLNLGGCRRLCESVRRCGAHVVVCTQAAVAAVLCEARHRGALETPVVAILTDYGVHPFWADPPADLILAPDPAAVSELERRGAPGARAVGIPIHPIFAVPRSRAEARRTLALAPAAPVVLLSGGAKGFGGMDRAAAALLAASPRAQVLALCGVNDRLRRSLGARREAAWRLRVFGPQPPELVAAMMAAADVHLGKPGGLSAAESLASGLPLVFARPSPGQEESNARRLTSLGAALELDTPEDAAQAVARLLGDRPALGALRAAAAAAGLPQAARAAVAEIAALARRELRSRG